MESWWLTDLKIGAEHKSDILANACEAILLHLESTDSIPEPSKLSTIKKCGFLTSLVDVNLSKLEGPSKRINLTIPANLLTRIDAAANKAGMTRSAYLADAALKQANSR